MTAYEVRISDWSSDVCSSDLFRKQASKARACRRRSKPRKNRARQVCSTRLVRFGITASIGFASALKSRPRLASCLRSEEHTSELQSLMRISYAVFCSKKKKNENTNIITTLTTEHSEFLHITSTYYRHSKT